MVCVQTGRVAAAALAAVFGASPTRAQTHEHTQAQHHARNKMHLQNKGVVWVRTPRAAHATRRGLRPKTGQRRREHEVRAHGA
jgi:hypothetical protein